jgi:hypothetical protein
MACQVDVMHLVQVNVICLQTLERAFHGLANMQCREFLLVRPVTHMTVDLGGNDNLFAPTATLRKPAPDNLLSYALAGLPSINIGGIKEVDAQLKRLIHDGIGVFLFSLWAKVHCPQAKPGNFQPGPAKLGVLHNINDRRWNNCHRRRLRSQAWMCQKRLFPRSRQRILRACAGCACRHKWRT